MSSFFLLQHYGCFCRSSSSLLLPLLLESAGHLCSHKVPIIQMMSHMSVADELNAKQFISRYSPESLPVWPWKMCLKAAERMPPKQPCTNRDCFIWIWMSTCRNKQHKCSYCSWNWIDIRLFFCMLMQGHTEITEVVNLMFVQIQNDGQWQKKATVTLNVTESSPS